MFLTNYLIIASLLYSLRHLNMALASKASLRSLSSSTLILTSHVFRWKQDPLSTSQRNPHNIILQFEIGTFWGSLLMIWRVCWGMEIYSFAGTTVGLIIIIIIIIIIILSLGTFLWSFRLGRVLWQSFRLLGRTSRLLICFGSWQFGLLKWFTLWNFLFSLAQLCRISFQNLEVSEDF